MDNPLMALLQDEDTGDVTFDLATVYSVDSGGLRLILKNQSDPTQKKYKKLSSYESPQIGDRVVLMKMSGTYVVLGSIGGTGALPGVNTVYAGAASGNATAASFRKLVGDDLPVVPVSKGGTGMSTIYKTNDVSEILVAKTGFTIAVAEYAQYGKVAMLRCQVTPESAHTSASLLTPATLVSGKRPVYSAMMGMYNTDVGYIGTNGDLNVYGTMASTTGRYGLYSTYILP